MTNPPLVSSDLHSELRDLGSRDLQLWSIGALVLTIVTAGFLALVAPNMMWKSGPIKIESRYLPQLFSGFILLIVLFNIYLLDQKRRLNSTRDSLVKRMLLTEYGEQSASRDQLTKLFNREYALSAIEREKTRSASIPYSVLMVDIEDFRKINTRYGNLAGDHILLVASQLIRSTFRGSDIVCRVGGDEFVVVMPDTASEQTTSPVARLLMAAQQWNQTSHLNYSLGFRCAVVEGDTSRSADAIFEDLFLKTRGDHFMPMLIAIPQSPALRA